MERFEANVNNNTEVMEVIRTATERSANEPDTFLVMSNKEIIILTHAEYKEEYEKEGYFTSMIFEHGNRVEA